MSKKIPVVKKVRTTLLVAVSILVGILIAGVIQDWRGDICTGFFGARISCVEQMMFPVVGLGLPVLALILAVYIIASLDKRYEYRDAKSLKAKKKNNK